MAPSHSIARFLPRSADTAPRLASCQFLFVPGHCTASAPHRTLPCFSCGDQCGCHSLAVGAWSPGVGTRVGNKHTKAGGLCADLAYCFSQSRKRT